MIAPEEDSLRAYHNRLGALEAIVLADGQRIDTLEQENTGLRETLDESVTDVNGLGRASLKSFLCSMNGLLP